MFLCRCDRCRVCVFFARANLHATSVVPVHAFTSNVEPRVKDTRISRAERILGPQPSKGWTLARHQQQLCLTGHAGTLCRPRDDPLDRAQLKAPFTRVFVCDLAGNTGKKHRVLCLNDRKRTKNWTDFKDACARVCLSVCMFVFFFFREACVCKRVSARICTLRALYFITTSSALLLVLRTTLYRPPPPVPGFHRTVDIPPRIGLSDRARRLFLQ